MYLLLIISVGLIVAHASKVCDGNDGDKNIIIDAEVKALCERPSGSAMSLTYIVKSLSLSKPVSSVVETVIGGKIRWGFSGGASPKPPLGGLSRTFWTSSSGLGGHLEVPGVPS